MSFFRFAGVGAVVVSVGGLCFASVQPPILWWMCCIVESCGDLTGFWVGWWFHFLEVSPMWMVMDL